MAQNTNISLSLANKIDILNKTQSFDARYGVYDTEAEALLVMQSYGLDGRLVAVYIDKPNGVVALFLYNEVQGTLDPVGGGNVNLQLGETPTTAYRGDRGKTAYDHSQLTSGNPHSVKASELTDFANQLSAELDPQIRETIITVGGTINNQVIPTNFLRFTNQVNKTILTGLGSHKDGLEVKILNATNQDMVLRHLDNSSSVDNQLYNTKQQHVVLPVGYFAIYKYSPADNNWVLMTIQGQGVDISFTQISTGGNYHNTYLDGDTIVLTNTNAQAIFTGFDSTKYKRILFINQGGFEAVVNGLDSNSLPENQVQIPHGLSSIGVEGTTEFVYVDSIQKWVVIGAYATKDRPEHRGLTESMVEVVTPDAKSETHPIIDYEVFRDAQNTYMTDAELNTAYPNAERGLQVVCELINRVYKKIKSSPSEWRGYALRDSNKEWEVSDGGAISAQATFYTFLKFVNSVTPTILAGMTNIEDGKTITIYNHTLQVMDLLHDSPSASLGERLWNMGEQDLSLPIGAKAIYRYSISEETWTMIGIFGAGYEPTLKGVGTRAMTVLPSGVVASEEVAEFKVWNEAITTDQSNSQLNILYPNAFQGFTVVCKNSGRVYEMDDENAKTWIWTPLNIV